VVEPNVETLSVRLSEIKQPAMETNLDK